MGSVELIGVAERNSAKVNIFTDVWRKFKLVALAVSASCYLIFLFCVLLLCLYLLCDRLYLFDSYTCNKISVS